MCHRYRASLSVEAAIEKFGIDYVDFGILPEHDYYPLATVPAVRRNDKGAQVLTNLEWGLLPRWWKPSPQHPHRQKFQRQCFNARSETVHQKPSYAEAFQRRRCLLLATEFCEQGYFFHLPDKSPIALAGLWESWQGEGEEITSCTMLTTRANAEIAAVHPKKRMPVILRDAAARDLWLSPDSAEPKDLAPLFVPCPDALLESYPA